MIRRHDHTHFTFSKMENGASTGMTAGIRAIDIVIAFALRHADASSTGRPVPWLAERLHISSRTPYESLQRLQELRLLRSTDLSIVQEQMSELLIAGARFMFPARAGAIRGGIPTASSAAPLTDVFPPAEGELAFVWPAPNGVLRGASIEPLHRSVPQLALELPEFHADMAIVDALRISDPRLQREAAGMLRSRLGVIGDAAGGGSIR